MAGIDFNCCLTFSKAGIIAEQLPGIETDSNNDGGGRWGSDERELGVFDGQVAHLFNSDADAEG